MKGEGKALAIAFCPHALELYQRRASLMSPFHPPGHAAHYSGFYQHANHAHNSPSALPVVPCYKMKAMKGEGKALTIAFSPHALELYQRRASFVSL
jgi:hypothetical protein